MKILLKIFLFVTLLFVLGCKPETQFYWGEYSQTLYSYKKSPGEKTLAEHKKSLSDIITISAKRRRNVPPGVNAELGVILFKEGKESDGLAYFDKEILLYPESKSFIEKIRLGFQTGGSK